MYIADLHIHSRYSRATSRECAPEHLDLWARLKGIGLVGTGDFTHPAWRQELHDKLAPAEEGLYCLREELRLPGEVDAPAPRFVVTGEISNIYKRGGRTRKVHNLILLPSLEAADLLAARLEAVGTVHSDGRPILGLDSRDLLELTLDACPEAVFIPAHIWTPHFSLFGAFSGFEAIEECYGDLTPQIHALETGLSSDPGMNWRVSALDRFTLVSNSDAHSPAKLGREANLIDGPLSYPGLAAALRGRGFAGTIEFFPEEGKYHLDGHRNCNLCLTPAQTVAYGGKCPVCGKKITVGVQHRVEQLADRPEGFARPSAPPYQSLAPLPEAIAASTGQSPTGVKVTARYRELLRQLGPEFYILRQAPLEAIARAAGPCVAEGIRRLREGRVERIPGYDGAYGVIRLLTQDEIDAFSGQLTLFAGVEPVAPTPIPGPSAPSRRPTPAPATEKPRAGTENGLNAEQQRAVTAPGPAVAVIAGPGTGKTKTLVSRIAFLVRERGVQPSRITAVTFTNRAAGELRERLRGELGTRAARSMTIGTFHAICLQRLRSRGEPVALVDEAAARELAGDTIREQGLKLTPQALLLAVSRIKNGLSGEEELPAGLYAGYCDRLRAAGLLDFDDLLLRGLAEGGEAPFTHLLVDEFQDINDLQYRLVTAWGRGNLFVIGDPDQAIYGFRGASARCFQRLEQDRPELETIRLTRNYRSTPQILGCALPVIARNGGEPRRLEAQRGPGPRVTVATADTELSEAIYVAKQISRLVGGVDMLEAGGGEGEARSFADIAVLYRTHRQAELLEQCLRRDGIPCTVAGRDDFLQHESVLGALAFFRFLLEPRGPTLQACLRNACGCPEETARSLAAAWERAQPAGLSLPLLEDLAAAFAGRTEIRRFLELAHCFLPRLGEKPAKLLLDWSQQAGLADARPLIRLAGMASFHGAMPAFLEHLLLAQEGDLLRGDGRNYAAGTVSLMTLHGAKGLEFPVVFLCGLRQGVLPLERGDTNPEEERRLFYVGMTRAREELYLVATPDPSPFLQELPGALLHREHVSPPRPEGRQLGLFDS